MKLNKARSLEGKLYVRCSTRKFHICDTQCFRRPIWIQMYGQLMQTRDWGHSQLIHRIGIKFASTNFFSSCRTVCYVSVGFSIICKHILLTLWKWTSRIRRDLFTNIARINIIVTTNCLRKISIIIIFIPRKIDSNQTRELQNHLKHLTKNKKMN